MGTALALRGISKSFGANRVLDDVSLNVDAGELISLVGPSGCGKSTLLRIIAGLELQDRGEVVIGDRNVDALSPRSRNIAMVFQSYALYPHMTAFENIAVPLTVSRLSLAERLPLLRLLSPRRRRVMREIAAEVHAVAAQLRIEPLLLRKPSQLSGGQRQRVALARAMVRDPSVFLMDEPLSNLDAQLRVHMRDELAELHQRLGATFVYVTHDQVEAMTMSTRVAMLDGGRLAQIGRPRELYERPATLAVARFIGTPTINVLPATVEAGGRLVVHGTPLTLSCARQPGEQLSVGLRPEALRLTGERQGDFAGRIRRVEHHGAELLLFVELQPPATGSVIVRRLDAGREDPELAPGRAVSVTVDAAQAHVFDGSGQRVAVTRGLAIAGEPVRAGSRHAAGLAVS